MCFLITDLASLTFLFSVFFYKKSSVTNNLKINKKANILAIKPKLLYICIIY